MLSCKQCTGLHLLLLGCILSHLGFFQSSPQCMLTLYLMFAVFSDVLFTCSSWFVCIAAVLTSRSCAGPQHTISLPPDLQGLPGGPAPTSRLGQGSHQRPARAQLPLAATQSVPAGSRLSAVTQAAYMDPTRLTSTNLGAQEQQQAMYGDRFAGSTALRRYSHVSDTQLVQK